MAFAHLLKSISMQKKGDFYFLSLAALWSIFAFASLQQEKDVSSMIATFLSKWCAM